jgi:hypothetical protein
MSTQLRNFETKTQANGAQTIDLKSNNIFDEHQIQIEVSAQPTAGALAIGVKTPGANDYATIESSVDMTEITATAAKVVQFSGIAETLSFTPASFDADKTYSVYVVSWKK